MFEITQKINTLKPPVNRFMISHGAKPDSLSYPLFYFIYLLHSLTKERYGLIMKALDPIKDFNLITDTYKKMRNDNVRPSSVTVYMMIEAYGKNGIYDKAIEMFDIGKGMGLRMTVNPYISVIRYLGKSGQVKRAFDTFELILTDRVARGPVCFHTIIEVFSSNNYLSDALIMLQKMTKEGYKPGLPTFALLLDPLLAGSDSEGVGKVVDIMKSAKVRPNEPLIAKFAEFEKRNNVGPYWE